MSQCFPHGLLIIIHLTLNLEMNGKWKKDITLINYNACKSVSTFAYEEDKRMYLKKMNWVIFNPTLNSSGYCNILYIFLKFAKYT